MNLNDKALLLQLSISQWTARRFDKKITKQIADRHGASSQVGRYNKSLLAENDYLSNVHTLTGAIRTDFYANTLAWGMEGTRLLPTANYLPYIQKYRKFKADWDTAVSKFIMEYPRLKYDARMYLPGGMYNEDDYPDTVKLTAKFNMDLSVMPIPNDDFRVALSSDELQRIQTDVTSRVKQAQQQAMQEVWQRLYDRVKHMADKLGDMKAGDDQPEGSRSKARLHDSTVENIRELCALLPRLNFADDPDLEAMRVRVEQSLASAETDALKTDKGFRDHTANEARSILSAMATFMGGD